MTAQELLSVLASKRRSILLGGMAMILHRLGRSTKDYDIWLDPLPDVEAWGKAIHELLEMVPGLQAQRIDPVVPGNWLAVGREAVASVGLEDGLVRLAGGDRPIEKKNLTQSRLRPISSFSFVGHGRKALARRSDNQNKISRKRRQEKTRRKNLPKRERFSEMALQRGRRVKGEIGLFVLSDAAPGWRT